MSGRGIKIKVRCTLCRKLRFHTSYHERARGFVCRRCMDFLVLNPTFRNAPFKGWGFWPTKKEVKT